MFNEFLLEKWVDVVGFNVFDDWWLNWGLNGFFELVGGCYVL